MLPALYVIALSVLFSGGPVRLCRIFVKFSGFVVIGVCHVGSISSAPSAQQSAGLRAVPRSHGMVCEGLQNVPSNLNSVPRCKVDCSKGRLSDDGLLAFFKLTASALPDAPFSDGDRVDMNPAWQYLFRVSPLASRLREGTSRRRQRVRSQCVSSAIDTAVN
jgi:hypothetical protein